MNNQQNNNINNDEPPTTPSAMEEQIEDSLAEIQELMAEVARMRDQIILQQEREEEPHRRPGLGG